MMAVPFSVPHVEQKSEEGTEKMICKSCGNKLDPQNPVCPNCGTVVSMNGGNGFWDMAGEPRRVPAQQTSNPVVREKVVVKEVKKPAIIPIALSAVLCLLCLIAMIAGRISAKKTVRELTSDYEAQLSQQKAAYETQIEQLESRINSLEEELNRPAEPQIPVRVLRSPTPETKPEGYSNPASSWLFGFFIEGPATSFRWEKQQSDGTWTDLDFDYRSVDSRYGLKIEQNLETGISKLVAVGLTQESAGIYKCTVITGHGSESVEVRLTIEPNNTPSSTPAITPSPSPTPSPFADNEEDSTFTDGDGTDIPGTPDNDQDSGWKPWGGFHG